MKESSAYWLSSKGKIIEIKTNHISYVRDNLDLFGLTLEDYQSFYLKYKEPFGFEGKARQDILVEVMKRGWIRIRNYGRSGWSVEVWTLNKKIKDLLFDWVTEIKGIVESGSVYAYDKINIHIISLEQAGRSESEWLIETSLDEILKGKLHESKEFLLFKDIVN